MLTASTTSLYIFDVRAAFGSPDFANNRHFAVVCYKHCSIGDWLGHPSAGHERLISLKSINLRCSAEISRRHIRRFSFILMDISTDFCFFAVRLLRGMRRVTLGPILSASGMSETALRQSTDLNVSSLRVSHYPTLQS